MRLDEGPGGRFTRSQFVRRAALAGAGVLAGGVAAERLLGATGGTAALRETRGETVHRFLSRPDLQPALLQAARGPGPLAPGLLFLTPSVPHVQQGALIADDDGEPVWFGPTAPVDPTNLRVARYRGRPVLTWWEGTDPGGLGRGTHVIADDSYRVIARVQAGNRLPSDLHEFLLLPSGNALLTSWETVTRDLRRFGGPANGEVVGAVVQELELRSGRVVFEWHSLDHIGLEESRTAFQRAYGYFDYFHANSIAPTDDGNLLVSARNTSALYKLDRGSGEVIWRLGGKRSDFHMGPGTAFAWQHDARPHGERLVSLFDDGSGPGVETQSRGLVLALDTRAMRASLQRAYPHAPSLSAGALGSTQLLANGNVLVGFGTEPYVTEFGPDGRPRLDLRLPRGGQTYRALRFPWVGRPLDQPRLTRAGTQLHVSWNGATEVASWQLHTGRSHDRLEAGPIRTRTGFETALPTPAEAGYAAVVALDTHGNPLGRSVALPI